MMHQPTALLQEQHEAQLLLHIQQAPSHDKRSPTHASPQSSSNTNSSSTCSECSSGNKTQTSLSQRLWRFVRENVLARPQRKVRSASYSPQSSTTHDERPRDSKRRAKSCGHALEQPRRLVPHTQRTSNTHATTAHAWRKSKMLQELEASTERSWSCCVPVTAVLRRKQQQQQSDKATDARALRRRAFQRTCGNCAQRVFALEAARGGAFFCSLDCKSSFEYLAGVQRLVDNRIDERDDEDQDVWATR